jgi:hypothetical protein
MKKIFAMPVAPEAPPAVNCPALENPAAALSTILLPPYPQLEPVTTDAIIKRFEPLLIHCPKNVKILQTLAEAYALKGMFDRSLSFYGHALEIEGGKNAAIEEAINKITLQKFDLELSQLDPKAPDHAAECERLQNLRLVYLWQAMEEPH